MKQLIGIPVDELTHIPEISWYNNNYYKHEKLGLTQMLFGNSDDDSSTDWYLIDLNTINKTVIGYSSMNDNVETILEG